MKKGYYSCDAGSLTVECGGSIIYYPNGYGDGDFKVYLFDDKSEWNSYVKEHELKYGITKNKYKFETIANFNNARVLNYDCLKKVDEENVIFTLNGHYSIYSFNGHIVFVKY